MLICERGHRFAEQEMGSRRDLVSKDPCQIFEDNGCCPVCGADFYEEEDC
jgi:hypothetical protein